MYEPSNASAIRPEREPVCQFTIRIWFTTTIHEHDIGGLGEESVFLLRESAGLSLPSQPIHVPCLGMLLLRISRGLVNVPLLASYMHEPLSLIWMVEGRNVQTSSAHYRTIEQRTYYCHETCAFSSSPPCAHVNLTAILSMLPCLLLSLRTRDHLCGVLLAGLRNDLSGGRPNWASVDSCRISSASKPCAHWYARLWSGILEGSFGDTAK
ncbi:hypothetical protein LXA43DRAFT_224325 [Ganoderma leucocontextum]|nr:hypothetical protein LXA43DRAFT_224325 [Ganoderma leucocontextum]